ncbi:phosphoribosylformylglycinamidine cyclo-ligase [Ellagibacter isourolithinifaciens]|uniref:phosphoribosylformylglycinamidine cyclo-ligase n=1 Tax=Ellagibacter isourolithinifaciens TaxID=2137581 RepID=UPI003AF0F3F3
MSEEITYAAAGVDTAEGARAVDAIKETVHSTYRPEVVGDIGGFGGLFSIAAAKGMEDPLLVSGTDGVGTKLKVAQLVGKHGTVGIDLVAMCVNDILACGAEPLFFLDYIAIGKLRREHVAEVVAGIGEGCRQAGCALIGGEMAEHPGVMDPDDYDLSGFTVGMVDRPKMLDPESVREGDVLIGLASSGLHSNGYSLARKVCVEGKSTEELLAPVDALDGKSVGEALLTPTRIYVKQVLSALAECPKAVRALAHITGGGITENLNRALNSQVNAQVDLGTWPVPAIAKYVCEAADLSEGQALKTFNMGVGMVLIVDPDRVDEVEAALAKAGETTYRVGRIVAGAGEVEYTGEGNLYGYEG